MSGYRRAERSVAHSLFQGIRRRRYARLIRRSGLFQPERYLEQCPEDWAARRDPLGHYLARGAAMGLDPNPFFDTSFYLETNPDVAAAGKNPLVHYLRYGAPQGRATSARFDTAFYVRRYPEAAANGQNPLAHYLSTGLRAGLPATPGRPTPHLFGLVRLGLEGLRPEGLAAVGAAGDRGPGRTRAVSPAVPEPGPGSPWADVPGRARRSVLVVGVYLADQPNTAPHVAGELGASRAWSVDQRWASLGSSAVPDEMKAVTVVRTGRGPKFTLINRLLAGVDLAAYEFVMVADDDIRLPPAFLDRYLERAQRYRLALAQPARTHGSFVDLPFVERLDGLDARRTRFVEPGPLFSMRRDAVGLLVPFDEEAPMGWGYDYVWPMVVEGAGLRMGIIDSVPVEHRLRRPGSCYDQKKAGQSMRAYLARRPHLDRRDAFSIVEAFR